MAKKQGSKDPGLEPENTAGPVLYKFVSGGSAFGLGHVAGELVEFDPNAVLTVVGEDEYKAADLVAAGVLAEAEDADRVVWEADQDINAQADKRAAELDRIRKEQAKAEIERLSKAL